MSAAQGRRQFLKTGLKWSVAAAAAGSSMQQTATAAPTAEILETRIISHQPELYHGWATLARRSNGELWVVCSGGREEHVCPFGQVVAMTSKDEGTTWTFPRVLLDTATDDRDAGIVETSKGTLLVTTFTSLAYEKNLQKAINDGSWPAEKIARWKAAQDRLTADERKAELGEWLIHSTDGGRSWSTPIPTVVNSPHGPVVLRDGRLLYAGKQLWTGDGKIGVAESMDDGLTWKWLAEIPTRPGDNPKRDYHELHMVEATDGTLVAQIRMEGSVNENETLQSESSDGGKTWSVPHPISVWGLPSHLLRLKDGRLLMSYGHRRKPFGNQARLSEDHGRTWSDPISISDDGIRGDLGYPSTVQLHDDSLLTIWYESMNDHPKAVLRQTHWRLK